MKGQILRSISFRQGRTRQGSCQWGPQEGEGEAEEGVGLKPNGSSVDSDDIESHQHSEDDDKNSCNLVEPIHLFPPQYFRASNQESIDDELTLQSSTD